MFLCITKLSSTGGIKKSNLCDGLLCVCVHTELVCQSGSDTSGGWTKTFNPLSSKERDDDLDDDNDDECLLLDVFLFAGTFGFFPHFPSRQIRLATRLTAAS